VRAVALHPDVLVATSAIWQTNCVIARRGEECFAIDSPILPDELDALPALLEQAAFPAPSGLLATHGDWDHLLGRLAFPRLALGCAESTAERLRAAPGAAQRELRRFDDEFLIERPRALALGAVQALPVPGRCGLGDAELELHPTCGHTADGVAIWIPWARVLVAGDYLSVLELPSLERQGNPLESYIATLERLRPLAQSAAHVVPGHGPVLDSERAASVLAEDRAELPTGRRGRAQRARHAQNVERVHADGP
jgi:glyoxylase-like metal-dependent hydrolase (beta-lactamase superfamily II)